MKPTLELFMDDNLIIHVFLAWNDCVWLLSRDYIQGHILQEKFFYGINYGGFGSWFLPDHISAFFVLIEFHDIL